jgi:hypothetical protein
MREERGVSRVLVGKPGKGLLGSRRLRWDDNIKMCLQEVECGDVDWIDQVQYRDRFWAVVSAVMNVRVP